MLKNEELVISIKDKVRDGLALGLFFPALPFLKLAGPRRAHLHAVRGLLDWAGVTIVAHHYYEPVYQTDDIFRDPDAPRALAGIDWNLEGQKSLLQKFRFGDVLRSLEGRTFRGHTFHYDNQTFGPGDAEALYSMIRIAKPKSIIEIGCGQSTLVACLAIEDLIKEDPEYSCRQICFEPFENPWLSELGIEIRRERIERSDLHTFRELSPNDLVFIDSSHVQRPMGDVEFEFLHILPVLPEGVIVHVHDIFSPRDYPARWLIEDRRFWNEQYLLEAFLLFNSDFEIMCAMNDLMHRGWTEFKEAFPILATAKMHPPVGSFWIRRKLKSGSQVF